MIRRNKSVQICGICGRLLSVGDKNYHPWEKNNHPWGRLIIRGSAFIRGEKGIIRGDDLVQWDPKYLRDFVVQIENTQ